MAVFSAETRALLQQAGWSEDRCVDTSEYEKSTLPRQGRKR